MLKLTAGEKKILNGEEGKLKQKMLESILFLGDFYGAKKLVSITGEGHIMLGFGKNGFDVVKEILNSLEQENLKTLFPFTIGSWPYAFSSKKEKWLGLFYRKNSVFKKQLMLEQKLIKLGLCENKKYLDILSLEKSQNIKYGDVLCWSDSIFVTFVNSVFGAKVNCSGPIVDLFCNILGKVPYYDLLTKEGRMASVIIKIDTENMLLDAGLLGVVVAQKANGKIPYVYGLEKILKANYDERTLAFLKDFSAGFASQSTVKIFHINSITKEAKKHKKDIILPNSQVIIVDGKEIEKVKENFELKWKNLDAKPNLCVIGEPDMSLYQLVYWTNEIGWELKQNRRKKLKIKTIFYTNNVVLEQFKKLPEYRELKAYGGKIRTISSYSNAIKNTLSKKIITNSNIIRQSQNGKVKFCKEAEILNAITGKKRSKNA